MIFKEFFKGGKTKEVIDIKNEHEKTVILVEPHANKLDDFCLEESNENLKQTRIRFLAKAGLVIRPVLMKMDLQKMFQV